jgi:15-cis-phytoene synthase/lycopene beta-cyclase
MIGDYLDLIFGPTSRPSKPAGTALPAQSELLPAPHPSRPCGIWPVPEPPVVPQTEIDRFLADRVPAEAHFSFRLLARLTRLVPRYPIDELLRGYSLDLAFPLAPVMPESSSSPIERLDDLLDYGLCVAGSVAELIVYLAWAERSDQVPPTVKDRETVLVKSREMGTALQLVNIARDLAGDGQEGRCYLPMSWFSGSEPLPAPPAGSPPRPADPSPAHLPLILGSQADFPWPTYALPLLALADRLATSSRPGIDLLPSSARAGVRAAAGGYLLIGKEIKDVWQGDVRERRTVKGWRRVLAVVYEVWCR